MEFDLALPLDVGKHESLLPLWFLATLSCRFLFFMAIHPQLDMNLHLEDFGLAHENVGLDHSYSELVLLWWACLLFEGLVEARFGASSDVKAALVAAWGCPHNFQRVSCN